jgi:hypothetical protein
MNAAAVQAETPAGAGTAPAVPAGGGRVRSGATGSRAESARRYPAGTPSAKGRQRWAARSRAAASSTDARQLRWGPMAGGVALAGKAGPGRTSDTAGRQLVRSDRRSWPAVGTATSPWAARRRPTRRLAGQKSVGAACRRLPGVGQRPRVGAVGGAAADQLQVSTRSARSAPRVLPLEAARRSSVPGGRRPPLRAGRRPGRGAVGAPGSWPRAAVAARELARAAAGSRGGRW